MTVYSYLIRQHGYISSSEISSYSPRHASTCKQLGTAKHLQEPLSATFLSLPTKKPLNRSAYWKIPFADWLSACVSGAYCSAFPRQVAPAPSKFLPPRNRCCAQAKNLTAGTSLETSGADIVSPFLFFFFFFHTSTSLFIFPSSATSASCLVPASRFLRPFRLLDFCADHRKATFPSVSPSTVSWSHQTITTTRTEPSRSIDQRNMSFSSLVQELSLRDANSARRPGPAPSVSTFDDRASHVSRAMSGYASTAATSVSIAGDIGSQLHGGYFHPLARSWQSERQLTKVRGDSQQFGVISVFY